MNVRKRRLEADQKLCFAFFRQTYQAKSFCGHLLLSELPKKHLTFSSPFPQIPKEDYAVKNEKFIRSFRTFSNF